MNLNVKITSLNPFESEYVIKSPSTKGEGGDENKGKRQSGKRGKGENRVERWRDFTKSRERFASAFL